MQLQKVFGFMSYDDYNGCEYLATNRPLLSLSPAILGMLKSFFWFLKGGRTYWLCYNTYDQFFNQDTKNVLVVLGLFEKNSKVKTQIIRLFLRGSIITYHVLG